MNTWTDPETGLTWQVEPAAERMTLAQAKEYAADLDLDGDGWRLPTKDELLSISGENRQNELHGQGWFWSSSPVGDYYGLAWYVGFVGGGVYYGDGVIIDVHVRCVR